MQGSDKMKKQKNPGFDNYITTDNLNKLSDVIFVERLKEAKSARTNHLNAVKQRAIKNEENIKKVIYI